jgi:transposase-like protein/DDE family transposase
MKLPKSSVERVGSVFAALEVGDPRRTRRVRRTVELLASNPRASFPEAMGDGADIEGAYRLMSSDRVTMDHLNEAHAAVTAERARSVGQVLAIHDTTTFEFKHAEPEEIGYLNTGKPGFLAHYTLVVAGDATRRPLGVAHVEIVSRKRPPRKRSPKGRKNRSGSDTVRDPARESTRWLRGFESTSQRLDHANVIHVADREGDNYELLAQAVTQKRRFVIRARVLSRRVEGPNRNGEKETLRTVLEAARGELSRDVELSARKRSTAPRASHGDRAARAARLEFAATRVVMPRPQHQDESLPEAIELNVVHVFEPNPPAGEEPVEWVLFTTEPVATAQDVAAVVDIYRARWVIEECNKAIKTGCRYEDREFETLGALLTLLALSLPIACELLWLRASCRRNPNAPASQVLTATQLQILLVMGSRKLSKNPTVHDALWAVAALGGHMKTNGEPGWLVLHRGMAKLLAYETGWLAREALAGLSISR